MANYIDYQQKYFKRREESKTFQAEIRAVISELVVKPGDRILELGCGSGFALEILESKGASNLVGLDWLATSMQMSAEKSSNLMLIRGDATRLPFDDGQFDKVFAQHLIEHFADTVAILSEWRRILKPGGRLVIVTPNSGFPLQDWFEDPTHHHIFGGDQLAQLATQAGLEVRECQTLNPYLFHWRLMGFAAQYLQFANHLPYLGERSMSLMLTATKPE